MPAKPRLQRMDLGTCPPPYLSLLYLSIEDSAADRAFAILRPPQIRLRFDRHAQESYAAPCAGWCSGAFVALGRFLEPRIAGTACRSHNTTRGHPRDRLGRSGLRAGRRRPLHADLVGRTNGT